MLVTPPRMFSDGPVRQRLFTSCVHDGVPSWDTVRVGDYAWACHVVGLTFTYVYGTRADCLRIRALEQDTVLMKGLCESLAYARDEATARTREMANMYEGIGEVLAVSARQFMQRRVQQNPRYRPELQRLRLDVRN